MEKFATIDTLGLMVVELKSTVRPHMTLGPGVPDPPLTDIDPCHAVLCKKLQLCWTVNRRIYQTINNKLTTRR